MKIYINKINESWIVDRLKKEWLQFNEGTTTDSISKSDIIWIIAPWTWKWNKNLFIKNKKIVYTIHHFEEKDLTNNFLKIINNKQIDAYHVLNSETKSKLEKFTNKPIYQIPFWINQNLFFYIDDKKSLRNEFNFSANDFLIGSFQRDTEGSDLKTPKLIKGPDRFITIIKQLKQDYPNLKIVLTGKRRQYIISKLKELKIEYKYFENTDFETLNKLYNCLNLYIVSSRLEGMPFAILESGISKAPVISTDVGIAKLILSQESIFDMNNFNNARPNVSYAYKNALNHSIPNGMKPFLEMFQEVLSN